MRAFVEHGKRGFAENVYHGSKKRFLSFIASPAKKSTEQFDFGIHFASDRRIAELYAGHRGWVYCCDISWSRIFDACAMFPGIGTPDFDSVEGSGILRAAVSEWMRGRSREHFLPMVVSGVYGMLIDSLSAGRLSKMLAKEGFDAVRYKTTVSRGSVKVASSEAFVITDPGNVKIRKIEEMLP